MKEMSTEKLFWVDAVKAICMIGVYLLHSEAHYGTGGISYGYWIEPFYVNAFFFVSGYLFFRKYLKDDLLINFKWGGVLPRNAKCFVPFDNPDSIVLNACLSSQVVFSW